MASEFRHKLKRIVPAALWVGARRASTFWHRLRIWRSVLREVEGVTATDADVIRQSASAGRRAARHNLDAWQDPILIADAAICLPGIGDFAIRARSDDLFAVLPSREREVVATFRQLLGPGATFVDAGANIGFFTVLASRLCGPSGRVIAIEMTPDTAARLRANIEQNRLTNVTVVEHALSRRTGDEIVASMPKNQFARASIADTARSGRTQFRVTTKTLDDVLADVPGPIDLIKMDLEGAESAAIEGASKALDRARYVIFEQLAGDAAGRLLKAKGFTLRMLDANNVLAEKL